MIRIRSFLGVRGIIYLFYPANVIAESAAPAAQTSAPGFSLLLFLLIIIAFLYFVLSKNNKKSTPKIEDMPQQEQVEPQEYKINLKQFLFSYEGRIRRLHYWLFVLALIFFSLLILIISNQFTGKPMGEFPSGEHLIIALIHLTLGILLFWMQTAVFVKRWQDLDKSGWMVLFNFVPIVNLFAFVLLGILRGTEGPNQYGPDPLVNRQN